MLCVRTASTHWPYDSQNDSRAPGLCTLVWAVLQSDSYRTGLVELYCTYYPLYIPHAGLDSRGTSRTTCASASACMPDMLPAVRLDSPLHYYSKGRAYMKWVEVTSDRSSRVKGSCCMIVGADLCLPFGVRLPTILWFQNLPGFLHSFLQTCIRRNSLASWFSLVLSHWIAW